MVNAAVQKTPAKINVNNATYRQLIELRFIGDKRARNIIEYREQNGPFNTLEDFAAAIGLPEGCLEKIKHELTV